MVKRKRTKGQTMIY